MPLFKLIGRPVVFSFMMLFAFCYHLPIELLTKSHHVNIFNEEGRWLFYEFNVLLTGKQHKLKNKVVYIIIYGYIWKLLTTNAYVNIPILSIIKYRIIIYNTFLIYYCFDYLPFLLKVYFFQIIHYNSTHPVYFSGLYLQDYI